MDIRCRHCAEPVDISELHDVALESGRTFSEVRSDYSRRGCEALGMSHGPLADKATRDTLAVLDDLCGDDVDFLASATEDAERWGLL